MYNRMVQIYNHLQDDESKTLFDARITYLIDHDKDKFVQSLHRLYSDSDWHSAELEVRISQINPKGIIIFGCGHDGRITNRLLKLMKYEAVYFCDNNMYGSKVDGKTVISVNEVIKKFRDHLVIIGSEKYGKEMYIELVQMGFPHSNILLFNILSYNTLLWASRGKQYFDMFKPQVDEVYVDAGAFDGGTILDFIRWSNGTYKKIFALEPIKNMYEQTKQKMIQENVERIEFINCAAWGRREELRFAENGAASHKSTNGNIIIQGVDIDSVVKDEKVTFIKMDIEGSELEALKGAKNTIRNHHPRLAICIYHKPIDVIEIPAYILELVPEYKFYVRHYDSSLEETVLYATV